MFQPTHSKVSLRTDGYSTEGMNDPVRFVGSMAPTTNLVTKNTRQTNSLVVYLIHMIFHLVINHCNGRRRERICSYYVPTSNFKGIPYIFPILYVAARLTTYHCYPFTLHFQCLKFSLLLHQPDSF